jgi:hypothetical protein
MDTTKRTPLRTVAGTILPVQVYNLDVLPKIHFGGIPPDIQLKALDYYDIDWNTPTNICQDSIRVWDSAQAVVIPRDSLGDTFVLFPESIRQQVTVPPPGRVEAKKPNPPEQFAVSQLVSPPGATLADLASLVLSKDAYKRIVAPHIADMRYEYAEAMTKGELRKARWIVARGYIQVLWPLVYGVFNTVVTILKLAR